MGRGPLVAFLIGTGLLTLANGMFNLLVGPAIDSRGHTEAMIGVIVATGSLSSLALRVPAGNAFRSGRATALVIAGSTLAAVGYGVLPMVSAAPVLVVLSALQGAGFAVATTAGMAALMERRPADVEAGSLMGWFTGSIGAGYALAGFVGGTLADAIGLRGALTGAAGAALVSGWVTARSIGRLRIHRSAVDDAGAPPLRGWVRGMPTGVWLGFAIAVYINLVNGGMNAFFPLYALGIGLSLSQIGALSGIHATLASTVRFGAGAVLGRTSSWWLTIAMVATTGLGVTAVAIPRGFIPLGLLVATVGLARGVLRVVSGAIVMEAAGSSRLGGRASGIYLAGLDLGNSIGPLIGGVVSDVAGLRGSFIVLGVVPAALFAAAGAALSGRARSREPGAPVTPEAP